jgi:hypothetical protein
MTHKKPILKKNISESVTKDCILEMEEETDEFSVIEDL